MGEIEDYVAKVEAEFANDAKRRAGRQKLTLLVVAAVLAVGVAIIVGVVLTAGKSGDSAADANAKVTKQLEEATRGVDFDARVRILVELVGDDKQAADLREGARTALREDMQRVAKDYGLAAAAEQEKLCREAAILVKYYFTGDVAADFKASLDAMRAPCGSKGSPIP